jgi:hypothetical protein
MDLMKSLLLWRTINARNARIDVNPRPLITSALEDQPRRNLRYCPSVELSRLVDGLRPQFQGIRLFRTPSRHPIRRVVHVLSAILPNVSPAWDYVDVRLSVRALTSNVPVHHSAPDKNVTLSDAFVALASSKISTHATC